MTEELQQAKEKASQIAWRLDAEIAVVEKMKRYFERARAEIRRLEAQEATHD